jgi:hypothetical protein
MDLGALIRKVLAPKGSKSVARINNLHRVYTYTGLNAVTAFIKLTKIDQYTTMSFLHSLKKHVGRGNIHYGITLQPTTQNMYTALGEGSSNILSILAGASIV